MSLGSDVLAGGIAEQLRHRGADVALWGLALLVYGVGDLASTLLGLRLGAEESNPIPAAMIDAAPGFFEAALALTLWKAATVAAFAALAWRLPSPYAAAIPLGLSLIGVVVVGWNASVLLTVAS